MERPFSISKKRSGIHKVPRPAEFLRNLYCYSNRPEWLCKFNSSSCEYISASGVSGDQCYSVSDAARNIKSEWSNILFLDWTRILSVRNGKCFDWFGYKHRSCYLYCDWQWC